VLNFARDARDRGIGVVLYTHNPHHAYMVGDEFVLLKRGRMTNRWLKEDVELDELIAAMAGGAELGGVAHELGGSAAPPRGGAAGRGLPGHGRGRAR
jgi:simple sugar transport system ATP-binding protein